MSAIFAYSIFVYFTNTTPRTSVSIPRTRVTRPNGSVSYKKLGYAFAELQSEQDAEKAVELLADKVLDERPLTVKIATGPVKKPRKKSAAKSATNTAASAESSKDDGEEKSEENTEAEPKEVKKKAKAKKNKKNKKAQQGEDDKKDEPLESSDASSTSKQKGSSPAPTKKKAARPKRVGPISTDTVLVRGLPADVTEEELRELFAEYKPEEIRIIKKRARTQKKGDKEIVRRPAVAFVFAKFSSEDIQQKVLAEVSDKSFKGKKLKTSPAVELVQEDEQAADKVPVDSEPEKNTADTKTDLEESSSAAAAAAESHK